MHDFDTSLFDENSIDLNHLSLFLCYFETNYWIWDNFILLTFSGSSILSIRFMKKEWCCSRQSKYQITNFWLSLFPYFLSQW